MTQRLSRRPQGPTELCLRNEDIRGSPQGYGHAFGRRRYTLAIEARGKGRDQLDDGSAALDLQASGPRAEPAHQVRQAIVGVRTAADHAVQLERVVTPLSHGIEDRGTKTHERVAAPRVVLGDLVGDGQLAEAVSQINRRLTRLIDVSDGARAQLHHITGDSAHHSRQIRHRTNDLPGTDVSPVDPRQSWDRPGCSMIEKTARDEVHPTAAIPSSTEAQVDRFPEPGAVYLLQEPVRGLLVCALRCFLRHLTLRFFSGIDWEALRVAFAGAPTIPRDCDGPAQLTKIRWKNSGSNQVIPHRLLARVTRHLSTPPTAGTYGGRHGSEWVVGFRRNTHRTEYAS